MPPIVRTGIDLIEKRWPAKFRSANIGLLLHPASITSNFSHSADTCFSSKKFSVSALFGPQHGIRGETQDNMIEWDSFRDKKTGIPVYSLYGTTRKPSPEMLSSIDIMVIDLQDVGARYYTFIWTMALVMEACQELNKMVVILDRPNPINGKAIEGPVLKQKYTSFVGLQSLPIRHGMTIGEIGLYFREAFYNKLTFDIIPMLGWKRAMWFDETGLPWVLPSPNMPTLDTATVYPGMCLLEGTNISEGRGTTRPFEIFGAPFIDPEVLTTELRELRLPGLIFRPLHFIPTFQKHAGKLCGGAQIHLTDREKFKPFKTAVAILKTLHDLYPKKFRWNNPPYEYEKNLLPIDILAGTDRLRKDIEQSAPLESMEACWKSELRNFDRKIRQKYLLY
ncbi:MAG: DUF1343 domain-containing protein [Nitrospirae bacterium]|nr:DUF1343 domain-containing protein [Nitrospirota bacterium]